MPRASSSKHDVVKTTLVQGKFHNERVIPLDGCQDIRVFLADEHRVVALGSYAFDTGVPAKVWKHAVVEFDGSASTCKYLTVLESPAELGSKNKNWTIFRHRERWLVHTNSYPELKLYEFAGPPWRFGKPFTTINTKKFFENIRVGQQRIKHVRGTSNWLLTNDNTYLTILHFTWSARPVPATLYRTYRSVFVEFDAETFEPKWRSDGVCFGHDCQTVQFPSSILWKDETTKDAVFIGYGVMDREAWVATAKLADIRAICKPL